MKRLLLLLMLPALFPPGAAAQVPTVRDFKKTVDSVAVLMAERTGVRIKTSLVRVEPHDKVLDLWFDKTFGDWPWTEGDTAFFRAKMEKLAPPAAKKYTLGQMYCKRDNVHKLPLADLVLPELGTNGRPVSDTWRKGDPRSVARNFVRQTDAPYYFKGLSGRNIALWQSHGRYYEEKTGRWEWQRSPNFRTVEDMYTQSYVLPFLLPMLEHAGAYVMTPRERDIQDWEVICDNDPAFEGVRSGKTRRSGYYSESGRWTDGGTGFADAKEVYTGTDNPFEMGRFRQAPCIRKEDGRAEAVWTPEIPERGRYAVYVSYKSLPNSTMNAHYMVRHRGGDSHFTVNQRKGGGTWVYLGTFEFEKGRDGFVLLDNMTPEKGQFLSRSVVTADAVRFGGGIGKIARGRADEPVSAWTTSGLPCFAEGASYWMQWAGVDSSIFRGWSGGGQVNDYTNDYASRGAWVQMLTERKLIPVDLSLAFHSDAGVTPNDSTVGTLAIYTLYADNKDSFRDGSSRMVSRELAHMVQSQIVRDIRSEYASDWARRGLWDRSYSESRTPGVPAMILELLSHQNFADMKFGLDPAFRFTVSRAVYKGILKFLSNRYGCAYRVQPLPVRAFSVRLVGDGRAELRWKPVTDPLEPTADPSSYLLETRIDDGAFDGGVTPEIKTDKDGWVRTETTLEPGRLYSFRVSAINDGGRSFPSEVLSAAIPANAGARADSTVLVVTHFDRVAPPSWFDTPDYAGFRDDIDGGVPWGEDISFIGPMYEFRRQMPWLDDDCPGFGGSFTDRAGRVIAGNSFDYAAVHGRAILAAGYPFCSASCEAYTGWEEPQAWAVDLVCGKQIRTPRGSGEFPARFEVFPIPLQEALERASARGVHLLVSGANIATDAADVIYPLAVDDSLAARTRTFSARVLGFRWRTNFATRGGRVERCASLTSGTLPGQMAFYHEPNETCYCVETPDGLIPADGNARTVLRYADTKIGAGICYDASGWRALCLGFPIETVREEGHRRELVAAALRWFSAKKGKVR